MHFKLLIGVSSIAIGLLLSHVWELYSMRFCEPYRIFDRVFGPSCSKMLSLSETVDFVKNNSVVKEINQIRPAYIRVVVSGQHQCPGKGLIVISHSSYRDCPAINAVLNKNKDAFRVPYQIIND